MTEPRSRVLIVEDEAAMRRFLRTSLTSHGYEALEAATAAEGIVLATQYAPELVLLDLGLPDRDGLEVTKELRQWSTAPIIVLSARGREDDKVQALDGGADDYLTKPFGMNELLARVRVALRHAARVRAPAEPVMRIGPLVLDQPRHEARVRGELVHFTPIEYRLLVLLAKNAGRHVDAQVDPARRVGPGRHVADALPARLHDAPAPQARARPRAAAAPRQRAGRGLSLARSRSRRRGRSDGARREVSSGHRNQSKNATV